MPEIELDLLNGETGTQSVDGHSELAAEAGCKREASGAGPLAQPTLTREGLAGLVAGAQAYELAGEALGHSEAASGATREDRYGKVGVSICKRRERAAEIGVAEQQRPGRGRALACRKRLALAAPRKPDYDRSGLFGPLRCPVPRSAVDDDDRRPGKVAAKRRDRLGDPVRLVPRGDEDAEVSSHPSWS
jgi:hypothetical protein